MEYKVVNRSGKSYYKGEDGRLYGEGYELAYPFESNGLAIVRKEDGKWYYINEKLETVSEGFEDATEFGSNGLAIVKKEDWKWYYINEKFETVSEGYLMAHPFRSNGLAIVFKEDGKFYYINEKFETVSKEFTKVKADSFASNGLAVGRKEDGLYYYFNEKFETLSEGYKDAKGFNEEGFAEVQKANGKRYLINNKFELVGSFDSKGNRKSEEEFRFDLYLDGEIEVYDLPDECFTEEYLDKLIENEKKVYEYLINMASTEEQMKKVKSDYESRADYIKGRAYEIDREKNKEKYLGMAREVYLNNEKDLF